MIDQAMKEFLSACGSSGPMVLGVEEPGTSGISWRIFDQPFLVVGRDPEADLFLKDEDVGRRHAYLQMIAGRLFCVDLQSRMGTRWGDDTGLWGWVRPEPGIGIGPYRLRPRDDAAGDSPSRDPDGSTLPVPVSRSFVQSGLPEATLEILDTPTGSATWRVSRSVVLIGGSQACKVRLPGADVADIHASLVRTPSGFFTVDLMGAGGLLVNGERVRYARLGEDDELSVGKHRIRVRCTRSGKDAGSRGPTGPRQTPGRPGLPTRSASTARPPAKVEDAATGMIPAHTPKGEDTASLVRSMLEEFGQVQLQMADRFQDSMMVVLQSFAGFHGEQMALIREELARIRDLTEEQQVLRSRVEGRGLTTPNSPALRLVTGESLITPGGTRPGLPPATPRKTGMSPRLALKEDGERARVDDQGEPRAKDARPRPAGSPVSADLHGQIVSRIAEIQEERQGRWQKLLKSLLG